MNKILNQYLPDKPVMPGELLLEYLEALGMAQVDLARRTGLTSKTVNEIVKGKAPISPETAIKLERVLGRPARFWMNLESNYQEDCVRLAEQARMESDLNWLARFPVRAMTKLGWIPVLHNSLEQVEALLRFFGIASAAQWEAVWKEYRAAYRQSSRFEVCDEALSAWLRRGELEAGELECEPYDSKRFLNALSEIRALTRDADPATFIPLLRSRCATAGVAVVFVPELPKTRVSGATRWVGNKPVIQLSFRYKSDDHFWFSFFHEAGHILRHGKKLFFVEGVSLKREEEKEVDSFAADFLIQPSDWLRFLKRKTFDSASVRNFADAVGIAPGIIVGRLQHENCLPYNKGNSLKVSYRWQ